MLKTYNTTQAVEGSSSEDENLGEEDLHARPFKSCPIDDVDNPELLEEVKEEMDEYEFFQPIVRHDRRTNTVAKNVLNESQLELIELNCEALVNMGKYFNKETMNSCKAWQFNLSTPWDSLQPFKYCSDYRERLFKESVNLVYNYFKLYHLRRYHWSVADCDTNQMLHIYKLVNILENTRIKPNRSFRNRGN